MKELMKKWQPLLDEGRTIANERIRKSTALVLDNQYKFLSGISDDQMMSEDANSWGGSSATMGTAVHGGSYSTSGEFHKIALPMVRRTFPELLAHEVVGVQPMTGPVGLAFALRFKAGTSVGDYTADTTELGYNTIEENFSGSYTTSGGEALGSDAAASAAYGDVALGVGLGIGSGNAIREVNMTVEKSQVTAETRKLRSRWSLEVAQDLKAMHGLNIEDEMMDILAYEITAEIDRELVIKLVSVATQATDFDYESTTQGAGRWESEIYRNLYNSLLRRCNDIARLTRRGAGNFVIASPDVCAGFESCANFAIHPIPSDLNLAQTGIARVGSFDGRVACYRDTFSSDTMTAAPLTGSGDNYFLTGYKGPSEYDTGVVYLPYIQLLSSKATYEDSFHPTVGLMSRYAIHEHIYGAQLYYQFTECTNMPS